MSGRFAQQLIDAADALDKLSRSELQVLLRRASLRLSNRTQAAGTTLLLPEVAGVIDAFAKQGEMSRDEAVNLALTDWAIGQGLMEAGDLDEGSETEGEA